jgi:hypothetical protein
MKREDAQAWLDAMANSKLQWMTNPDNWIVVDPSSLTGDSFNWSFRHLACGEKCVLDKVGDTFNPHGSIGGSDWKIIGYYNEYVRTMDIITLPVLNY